MRATMGTVDTESHCTVQHCTIQHCTTLHYMTLHGTVLQYSVLHSTVPQCMQMHCFVIPPYLYRDSLCSQMRWSLGHPRQSALPFFESWYAWNVRSHFVLRAYRMALHWCHPPFLLLLYFVTDAGGVLEMSERQQSQRETESTDGDVFLLPNIDVEAWRVGFVRPIGIFFLSQPATPRTKPRLSLLLCEEWCGWSSWLHTKQSNIKQLVSSVLCVSSDSCTISDRGGG